MENIVERPKRKSPKRILIDVPEELHTQIKSLAALRNISIKIWLVRLIISELRRLEVYK